MEDLDELILLQLKNINRDAGQFATTILTNEITEDEQIRYAHRLVDLAEAIRDRAISATGQVVESR
jgi:hypothetical protein